MKKGSRVQVIPEMRSRFWDIGAKAGTVTLIEVGVPVIVWDRLEGQTRIKPEYLEIIDGPT